MSPPALLLTFDDGPDPVWTPRVLRELERLDVTATFFFIGERISAAPAVARDAIEAGHAIGLHCFEHVRHSDMSESEIARDTSLALAAFAGIGVRPRLWRTPWGVCTRASARVAERFGLELVRWTIDTHDWRGDEAPAIYRRLASDLGLDSIVLMHDGIGPGALREDCAATLALLEPLVGLARARRLLGGERADAAARREASTLTPAGRR